MSLPGLGHTRRKEIVENNDGIQTTRHTKKVYGKALTPYQRVMESNKVPMGIKIKLTKRYESLSPVTLRARISTLQSKLNKLQKQLGYHYELKGLR